MSKNIIPQNDNQEETSQEMSKIEVCKYAKWYWILVLIAYLSVIFLILFLIALLTNPEIFREHESRLNSYIMSVFISEFLARSTTFMLYIFLPMLLLLSSIKRILCKNEYLRCSNCKQSLGPNFKSNKENILKYGKCKICGKLFRPKYF